MHIQSTEMCARETTKQETSISYILHMCLSVYLLHFPLFLSISDLNLAEADVWSSEVIDIALAEAGRDCNGPLRPPDLHQTAADLQRAVCGVTYCETASQLDKEMAHPHAHSHNTVLTAAIASECQSPAVHHCV